MDFKDCEFFNKNFLTCENNIFSCPVISVSNIDNVKHQCCGVCSVKNCEYICEKLRENESE